MVANPEGIHILYDDGSSTTILDIPVAVAFDDLQGGVIFQSNNDPFEPGDTTMYRLGPSETESAAVLAPSPGEALRLFGVEAINGSPALVFSSRSGEGLNNTETLRYLPLGTGVATDVRVVGGYESGTTAVSWGGDQFLVQGAGEGFGWFNFMDLGGDPVDQPHDPMGDDCFVGDDDCPSLGEIAPDGKTLIYLISDPDDPESQELRQLDLTTGDVLASTSAMFVDASPYTIDFYRGRTVINRSIFTSVREWVGALHFEQIEGGSAEVVPMAGHAQIIRSPILLP